MEFNSKYYKENVKRITKAYLEAETIANAILELDFKDIKSIEYKSNTRDQHWYIFRNVDTNNDYCTKKFDTEVDKALNSIIPLQKKYCNHCLAGVNITDSKNPFKTFDN